jgi:Fe-S oxidoreductase
MELLESRSADMVVQKVEYCCSEAGTLALSRPDISLGMLDRKRNAIEEKMQKNSFDTILTNCPSCLQGLGRHRDFKLKTVHLAQELAVLKGGKKWKKKLKRLLRRNEVVTF